MEKEEDIIPDLIVLLIPEECCLTCKHFMPGYEDWSCYQHESIYGSYERTPDQCDVEERFLGVPTGHKCGDWTNNEQ